MDKLIRYFLFACWTLAAPAMAQPAPQWEDAKKAILEDYKRHQPDDKVLELVRAQQSELRFLAVRHFAKVTVERADKTRTRDHVYAEYRLVGDTWQLSTVSLIGSQALPDLDPPSSTEAQRLFNAIWHKDKCEGYDISGVKLLGEPRFQLETTSDRAKAKRWFVYDLEVSAKGNGKFRLSEDGAPYLNKTQNLLLWDPADRKWSVEQQQVRCSFVKQK